MASVTHGEKEHGILDYNQTPPTPNTGIFNAAQVRDITKSNELTLDKILESIKSGAKMGHVEYRIFGAYVSMLTIGKLISLGFMVSESIGPVGEKIIVISWL